jgi:hypothetical protein
MRSLNRNGDGHTYVSDKLSSIKRKYILRYVIPLRWGVVLPGLSFMIQEILCAALQLSYLSFWS